MDTARLSSLVLEHLDMALLLAVEALDLVDVPEDITLTALQVLEEHRQRLEVSTVALLLEGGMSWQAMADELGVARQSLHRRLSRKTLDLTRREQGQGTDLEYEWRRLLARLSGQIGELGNTSPGDVTRRVTQTLQDKATDKDAI
jgi:hypothetical protein